MLYCAAMRFPIIAVALLIGTLTLQAETVRIGTFDQRAVALAFYRSDLWASTLRSKVAERNAAKQAGNTELVTSLEKWGKAQQELAHRQVFEGAPIPNVLEHLSPAFAEVAKDRHLAAIVSDLRYAAPSTQQVDLTDAIVDWLKSSSQTRAMVKTLRDKGPAAIGTPHGH